MWQCEGKIGKFTWIVLVPENYMHNYRTLNQSLLGKRNLERNKELENNLTCLKVEKSLHKVYGSSANSSRHPCKIYEKPTSWPLKNGQLALFLLERPSSWPPLLDYPILFSLPPLVEMTPLLLLFISYNKLKSLQHHLMIYGQISLK